MNEISAGSRQFIEIITTNFQGVQLTTEEGTVKDAVIAGMYPLFRDSVVSRLAHPRRAVTRDTLRSELGEIQYDLTDQERAHEIHRQSGISPEIIEALVVSMKQLVKTDDHISPGLSMPGDWD